MKRMKRCLFLLMLTILARPAMAAEDRPAIPPPSDDAAVWYLTAIVDLQDEREAVEDSYEAEMILGETRRDHFDLEKAGPIIDHLQGALRWVRRGSTLDRCTWPTTLEEDGVYALLPHLTKMRQLSRIFIVSAMVREARGDLAGSTEECLTVLRMAPHAAVDQTFISILVQYSMQHMAVEHLAGQLEQYDRAGLEALRVQLGDASKLVPLSSGITAERASVSWLRRLYEEQGLEYMAEQLNTIQGDFQLKAAVMPSKPQAQEPQDEPANTPRVKAARKIEIKSAEQFEAWLKEWEASYDEMDRLYALPVAEFQQARVEFEKRLDQITMKNANPLMSIFLPALGAARRSEVRAQARANMLDAMIAYRLGGKEAFGKVIDPLTGKPYDFDVTEEGVVLSTPYDWLKRDDKPWSLTFPAECATPLE